MSSSLLIHYLFVDSLYMFLTVQFIFGYSLRYWRKLYNYFSHWVSGWLWSFQSIVTGMFRTFQDPNTPRPHLLKGDNNILNPSLEWKFYYWKKKINWWTLTEYGELPCRCRFPHVAWRHRPPNSLPPLPRIFTLKYNKTGDVLILGKLSEG